jgi:hypothetical protein
MTCADASTFGRKLLDPGDVLYLSVIPAFHDDPNLGRSKPALNQNIYFSRLARVNVGYASSTIYGDSLTSEGFFNTRRHLFNQPISLWMFHVYTIQRFFALRRSDFRHPQVLADLFGPSPIITRQSTVLLGRKHN